MVTLFGPTDYRGLPAGGAGRLRSTGHVRVPRIRGHRVRDPPSRQPDTRTCEQWIKEGKNAIKWTRLSCRSFDANAVRLQLHALAYNLGNFLRTLAIPEAIAEWSLTTLREKLIKIGARVVSHGRYVAFQMAEVAIPRKLFAAIAKRITALRSPPLATPT